MVNIHNMMEELVAERVNQLYEQVKEQGAAWLTCDCENCRLDTISYVLNRIPPRYVVSGRGVTHNKNLLESNIQLSADIDHLSIEGMKLVSASKRPYHRSLQILSFIESDTPVFNFPTFVGNVYDGQTFEPLSGAKLRLILDGKDAKMMDASWQNPCETFPATQGTYSFRVHPLEAEEVKLTKVFDFTMEVTAPGYQEVVLSFSVPLASEKIDRRQLNSTYSLTVQDIFLFKEGVVNEQE